MIGLAGSRTAVARPASGGFTIIELVVVIVILGILAVTALPRFFDTQVFEARGFHDETLALLGYARKAALAKRRTVCVAFSATGASLTFASSAGFTVCDSDLAGPNGQAPYRVSARTGVAYAALPTNFYFDAAGRPSSSQTLAVAGVSSSITVEAGSGYVHP